MPTTRPTGGLPKRQRRKAKRRRQQLAHEIDALVGKSSGQTQHNIKGDLSPFASLVREVGASAALRRRFRL